MSLDQRLPGQLQIWSNLHIQIWRPRLLGAYASELEETSSDGSEETSDLRKVSAFCALATVCFPSIWHLIYLYLEDPFKCSWRPRISPSWPNNAGHEQDHVHVYHFWMQRSRLHGESLLCFQETTVFEVKLLLTQYRTIIRNGWWQPSIWITWRAESKRR